MSNQPKIKSMKTNQLTYAQQYYIKIKAKRAGMSVEEYMSKGLHEKRGKRAVTEVAIGDVKPVEINFDRVQRLSELFVNDDMMRLYRTNTTLDTMFSHEGGIPVGTNVMVTGDPGTGKTTMMMYALSRLQKENPNAKCVFVSAEMSKLQVFKYTKRFPEFANLETMFTSDFMNSNIKDVMEQLLDGGYDFVLIDSIIEIFESLKEDCGMSQGQAEKWLTNLCVKHNEGNNAARKHTTFLLIQQVTKSGNFLGSNRIKHITDAHLELKRESDRDGGGTYCMFSKNRNGQAGVRYGYRLGTSTITYDMVIESEADNKTFELQHEMAF